MKSISITWFSFLQLFFIPVNGGGFGVPVVGKMAVSSIHPLRAPLHNYQNMYYYGHIKVGTPRNEGDIQEFNVIFDTGSIDLIIINSPFQRKCTNKNPEQNEQCRTTNLRAFTSSKSKTCKLVEGSFSVSYLDGTEFTGHIANDFIEINGIRIKAEIGMADVVINEVSERTDGVFGLGFGSESFLNPSILSPLESIFTQTDIPGQIGFYIEKGRNMNVDIENGGEIYFGGYNPDYVESEFTDPIPIAPLRGAISGWHIAIKSIRVGSKVIDLESQDLDGDKELGTVAMPDTGASMIVLCQKIYNEVVSYIFGEQQNHGIFTDLLFLCGDLPENLPDITFEVNDQIHLTLGPEDYLDTRINGLVCSSVLQGSDYEKLVLGYNFLQKYYTVFDFQNKEIKFANAKQRPVSTVKRHPSKYGRERMSQYSEAQLKNMREECKTGKIDVSTYKKSNEQ